MVDCARTQVFLVLLFGACVRSQAVPCGDLLCPEGSVCTKGSVCVAGALATACAGRADGEVCALSELGNGTCQDSLCIVGKCGDGMVNGIEACDTADLGGKTCADFGSIYASGLACTSDCSFDKSGCKAICGDGHKDPEEECDDYDFGGKTCTDLSPPGTTTRFYPGGVPTCTNECKINVSSCSGGYCGNFMKEFVEDCDGDVDPQVTCTSLGHPGDATPPTCDVTTCTFAEDTCSCGPNGICPAATPRCVKNGEIYACSL
jgi:hypothetical protein